MNDVEKIQSIDAMIQVLEGSKRTYKWMCYLFAIALAGLFVVINESMNPEQSIITNSAGGGALMLLLAHSVYKSKLESKICAAIRQLEEKKTSEPNATGQRR